MKDFDNRSNTDRRFDEFYNNTDRYSDYNSNFNSNHNNDRCPLNSSHNNVYNDRNYTDNYDKNIKEFERNHNQTKKGCIKPIIFFLSFFSVVAFLGAMGIILFLDTSAANETNPVKQQQLEQMAMYIFFGIFTLAGLGMLILPKIDKKIKLNRCKCVVKATVVGYKNRSRVNYDPDTGREGKPCVSPEYEFFYMGKIYQVTESSSRNYALPEIGSQIDMLINEEDPYDFYVEEKTDALTSLFIGFLFLAIGIVGLILWV